MPTRAEIQQIIASTAAANGFPPALALAIADRESSFNPNARASQTIYGLYQMDRDWRERTGIGNSSDPATQTVGMIQMWNERAARLAETLGRQPTDGEVYVAHHLGDGGARSAFRLINNGQGDTPMSDVVSRTAYQINPHFARAGSVGNFVNQTTADIDRRVSRWANGEAADPSVFGFEGRPTPPGDVPNVRMRDNGAGVRELQQQLNEVLGTNLRVDGQFGPRTREAVRDLQSVFGIPADGIYGPMTRAMMRSEREAVTQRQQDEIMQQQGSGYYAPLPQTPTPDPVPGATGPYWAQDNRSPYSPNMNAGNPARFNISGAFEPGGLGKDTSYPLNAMEQAVTQPFTPSTFAQPQTLPPMAWGGDQPSSFNDRFAAARPMSNDMLPFGLSPFNVGPDNNAPPTFAPPPLNQPQQPATAQLADASGGFQPQQQPAPFNMTGSESIYNSPQMQLPQFDSSMMFNQPQQQPQFDMMGAQSVWDVPQMQLPQFDTSMMFSQQPFQFSVPAMDFNAPGYNMAQNFNPYSFY
jgi:peptidoglycan hydrolase-like protein with peptidoglycan-binding domain